MNSDAKYFVALNTNIKIGPARFKKLLAYFGSAKNAWQGKYLDYQRAGILEKEIIESIFETREKIDPDEEMAKLKEEKIDVITIKDKRYPKLLSEIYNPPALLYIKGELKPEDELSLAIVGTRKLSNYGRQITPKIASYLARNQITIISGLALGIDSLAHRAALDAGGRTIAVLAGGVDELSIYPPINRKLALEIVQKKKGAIISEQHIGTPCLKQYFPARNRIIAGFSLGTLVVEAPGQSGALITAKLALDADREVFAVPGNILSPQSLGPNNLIKMGAKTVTGPEDILDELNIKEIYSQMKAKEVLPEGKLEKIIFKILSADPMHIDKIIKKAKLDTSAVISALTMMEIKGHVKNLGAGNYVKK